MSDWKEKESLKCSIRVEEGVPEWKTSELRPDRPRTWSEPRREVVESLFANNQKTFRSAYRLPITPVRFDAAACLLKKTVQLRSIIQFNS